MRNSPISSRKRDEAKFEGVPKFCRSPGKNFSPFWGVPKGEKSPPPTRTKTYIFVWGGSPVRQGGGRFLLPRAEPRRGEARGIMRLLWLGGVATKPAFMAFWVCFKTLFAALGVGYSTRLYLPLASFCFDLSWRCGWAVAFLFCIEIEFWLLGFGVKASLTLV
jgi:hypothetical protein